MYYHSLTPQVNRIDSLGMLCMKPWLSEFVFLRLSLVHCSFKVEMLSRGVDSLFCSWYLLQYIKKTPFWHVNKVKHDFNLRGSQMIDNDLEKREQCLIYFNVYSWLYLTPNVSETWLKLLRTFHTDVPSCSLWKTEGKPCLMSPFLCPYMLPKYMCGAKVNKAKANSQN